MYVRGSDPDPRPGRYLPRKERTPSRTPLWIGVPVLLLAAPLALVTWPIMVAAGRHLPERLQAVLAAPSIIVWLVLMSL